MKGSPRLADLLYLIPRSELPTQCARPRPARGPGNYNSSSISNARKAFCGVTWTGPVGPAAADVAKSLSDTEMYSFEARYPYPVLYRTTVPRIRKCALRFALALAQSHLGLRSPRPRRNRASGPLVPTRRTSTLKYLFVFSSASVLLFVFGLFHLLPAHHYISDHLPSTNSINLAAKPTPSSPPSHTIIHNVFRFCSRRCQGHQVRP